MKRHYLLSIILVAIFAIASCSGTGTQKKAEPPKQPTAKPAASESKPTPATDDKPKAEESASDLNPEDIDLEKPFEPTKLAQAVAKNEAGWKDKVVTLMGTSNGFSVSTLKSGKVTSYMVQNDKGKAVATCSGPTPPPDFAKGRKEGRVFKGTVKYISGGMLMLEPCEMMK